MKQPRPPQKAAQKVQPRRLPDKPLAAKTNWGRWYWLLIVLVVLSLYGNSVHNQYVKMDDADLIVDNEAFIKHLKNLPQAFKQSCFEVPGHLTDNKSYYRPLLIVSFMLDAQPKGAAGITVFHFMNIAYHILACLLLYFLLLKLGANRPASLVLALLFAVHPVNVQAVAWIPGRNDILLAIFVLLSLHGLVDYHKNGKPAALVVHILAFAAALFTKESGVFLLLIYGLFMGLWIRDLGFFKRKLVVPVLYAMITVGWFFAMRAALKGKEEIGGGESVFHVVIQNAPYLLLYIGKILLPFNLNVQPGVDTEAVVLGLVSLAALGILLFAVKDRRKALFSIAWYFIFLGPTLLVPELPAYEHRDYLPLIGLVIGISQAGFFKKFGFGSKNKNIIYTVSAMALVFVIIVYVRLPIYKDAFSYWNDSTEGTPFAPLGCVNMGQNYQDEYNNIPNLSEQQKKALLKNAADWNHKALMLNDTIQRANNNYGAALYLSGEPDQAFPYFQKEIKYHPNFSDPYQNIAKYYQDKGLADKSVWYWEKMLQLNHYNTTAYEQLSNYYIGKGEMDKAIMYRDRAKAINDSTEEAYRKIR